MILNECSFPALITMLPVVDCRNNIFQFRLYYPLLQGHLSAEPGVLPHGQADVHPRDRELWLHHVRCAGKLAEIIMKFLPFFSASCEIPEHLYLLRTRRGNLFNPGPR